MSGIKASVKATERRIQKDPASLSPQPNLLDYEAERARFNWADAWKLLDGLPGGRGCNIAHEAVDRHTTGPLLDALALS